MDRIEFVAKTITEIDKLVKSNKFEQAMHLFVYSLAIVDNQSARNMIQYYDELFFNKTFHREKETHSIISRL